MHHADKTLSGRRWVSRAWITCRLEYKNWREPIFADHHYTQLFFVDEATALAAGHRPCALCRLQEYRRFQQSWQSALRLDVAPLAPEMDGVLHQQRLTNDRRKRLHMLPKDPLPVGTMVLLYDGPALRTEDGLRRWSFSGYDPLPLQFAGSRILGVLTPPAIVAVLRQGYRPHFHPTARALPR